MQSHPEGKNRPDGLLLRDALISFGVLLLVFAAFDDITTDNATSFRFEYTALIFCAAWLSMLGVRLIKNGHRVLGAVSLAALGAAVWSRQDIGPGITPGLWPGYVMTTGAFLWFVALATMLLVRGWRGLSRA